MKLDRNMHFTPFDRTEPPVPVTQPSLATATNLVAIERHASIFDRWRAGHAASRQAAQSLAELKTERVLAEGRIAGTALKLAEVQIKSALVASSMMRIGALAADLNQKTTAVEERLTTGNHAEIISHIERRAESLSVFKTLEQEGRIAADEAAAMCAIAQADLADNINRSRERNQKSKEVIGVLHDFALDGIVRAKDGIS